jgi:hypothetical protein
MGAALDERRDTIEPIPLRGLRRCRIAMLTLLAEMGDIDTKSEFKK